MSGIPRDRLPDSSLAVLREGYRFIQNRAQRYQSDIFTTRLMLRKATCVTGMDAAAMFYQPDRFTRVGAMPPTSLRLLQDVGSVQTLDDEAHRHRKGMFMSIMSLDSIESLMRVTGETWDEQIAEWSHQGRIVLLDEAERLLAKAALRWCGLDPAQGALDDRTQELSAMIAGAGGIGPETWRAFVLRQRCERWARRVVRRIRSGKIHVSNGSPAAIIANHRDLEGKRLPSKIAAVEMINLLRPIVAVARYVVFIAHALEHNPPSRQTVLQGTDRDREWFVQEVRRHYPFFPFIGGIARTEIEWSGYTIQKGDWVILDIYGTNHDRRTWEHPDAFDPSRFEHWDKSPYTFIPQGGGDHFTTHRCAGEWITIELMKQASLKLTRRMTYEVPQQDLSISMRRMPAQPASCFIMSDVRSVTSP